MAERRRELATHTGGFGYYIILALIRTAKTLLTHPRMTGQAHIPRTGGVLLVSNHVSIADPVVLMAASPRPLVFMGKEELFRPRLARLILKFWGGSFPVRRGQNDIGAVRDALALLSAGYALVVFPEGTRHPAGLGPALPGIGYLATRANCAVIPTAIVGTDQIESIFALRRRPQFEVHFGQPFDIPRNTDVSEAADLIMRRIATLLPPDKRGVYVAEAAHAI